MTSGRYTLPFDKCRFFNGKLQKIGGDILGFQTPCADQPHTLHAWSDQQVDRFLAAGTYRKLYVYDVNGAQNDITPFRLTGTLGSNPFTTTNGSNVIAVSQAGHGVVPGDTIIYAGAATFNGVTLNGTFFVNTVTDINNFTFIAAQTATGSGAGGGGAVTFQYEINVGTEVFTAGFGWGVGGWGLGTWGTSKSSSVIVYEPRIWSLDHFGKIIIASYNSGSLYTFDPTQNQPWPRAQIQSNSPTNIRYSFVTPEEFVFALCEGMVVSACSQGDYTTWTPATNNTAFSRTLATGTKLMGGEVLAPYISLVWSDAALYSFQYTGSQYVYASAMIAKDCGLVGPNGSCTANGIAYWWGFNAFLYYDGASVRQLPNIEDVRRYVYDNININDSFHCAAVFNPIFNEIWFIYSAGTATEATNVAIYSITDQCWAVGTTTRISGINFTFGDNAPYMGDANGFIYLHEQGHDDNGTEITWIATLAPVPVGGEGKNTRCIGIDLDFFQIAGTVTVTVNAYDRLSETNLTAMDSDTEVVTDGGLQDFDVTGRYLGITYGSSDMGGYIRMGKHTAELIDKGTRR
jgi:hypothetical protein